MPISLLVTWLLCHNIPIPWLTAGEAKKRGHFVLRLVTLEILIKSSPNLAKIKAISFLRLSRNLFDSTLENKVAS